MKILGISAFYHDSAAVIISDSTIIAAAQEERFTRKKHDSSFPALAIKYCLEQSGFSIDELDSVVFYDKPLLKFERLLETYYGFAPKGLRSFITAMPVWVKEKLFLKKIMRKELEQIEPCDTKKIKFLFPEHHLSHAASAFYPSSFDDAAILTIDGVGEWATASISHGNGNSIKILKELHFPHSLGLLYSAFTYFLGFRVNSGEYKLMGLAPYGIPDSEEVLNYIQIIKRELIDIKEDGSLWLNQSYFTYATGLQMVDNKKWSTLFGFPRRETESEIRQEHCNLGLAIQLITEEVVIKMAKEAKRLTGSKNLCIAGGVALNCVANGKLLDAGIFEDIFIQPAAGDAGGALGAALSAFHIYFEQDRKVDSQSDSMAGTYLGPEYSDLDIIKVLKKYKAKYRFYEKFSVLCDSVSEKLDSGNAVGWFQGRMEFGPRALGNRSILGDARNPEMQKKLNLQIKNRESFRPFAPSVLAHKVHEVFELKGKSSPYMLLVQDVQEDLRSQLPDNYFQLPLKDRLYVRRSTIPAVTHIDFSARIQTVHGETNPNYFQLLTSFEKLTDCSLLINTSFNVRGEPIVCTPEDAYRCFMRTDMDYLVLGDYVIDKKMQQPWVEKEDWKQTYLLD